MLSEAKIKDLKKLYKKLNIKKQNDELMNEALTHPSYNFERNLFNEADYERLEFLGDSVLRITISEYLYDKYPNSPEGELTKIRSCLVSDKFLYTLGLKLEINKYINIGKHEEKNGGRDKESIIACTMEAIMGAVYKSNGFEQAKNFVLNLYSDVDIKKEMLNFNAKEILQEYTQARNKDLPEYKIEEESGKDHDKTYKASVYYHGKALGTGKAKTKREAEKEAALEAIKVLGITEDNNG